MGVETGADEFCQITGHGVREKKLLRQHAPRRVDGNRPSLTAPFDERLRYVRKDFAA
ncbi:hypothetical protein D3C83_126840 [compost metagenome]